MFVRHRADNRCSVSSSYYRVVTKRSKCPHHQGNLLADQRTIKCAEIKHSLKLGSVHKQAENLSPPAPSMWLSLYFTTLEREEIILECFLFCTPPPPFRGPRSRGSQDGRRKRDNFCSVLFPTLDWVVKGMKKLIKMHHPLTLG